MPPSSAICRATWLRPSSSWRACGRCWSRMAIRWPSSIRRPAPARPKWRHSAGSWSARTASSGPSLRYSTASRSKRKPSAPRSVRRSPSWKRRFPSSSNGSRSVRRCSARNSAPSCNISRRCSSWSSSSRTSSSRRAATARRRPPWRRTRFGEFAEAERKMAGLQQDLIKAEQRTKLQLLTAPVDGIVQQLAVHTVGGVVTPAQALLVLVPVDGRLEIEATVPNRDIGFVAAGQDAEIKVDTFNFTRYGILHGKVLSVSQDAIARDKPPDRPNDKSKGTESGNSEPQGQELGYAARVSLDRTRMQVGDNLVNLSPGMAVTVEIKTGSRTVMSYLLSPLLRYKQDSLRER